MSEIDYTRESNNWMVPGYVEATQRLRGSEGHPSGAFNSLDLPFDAEDAEAFMDATIKALIPKGADPDWTYQRLLNGMLLLAIVAVEADRKERRDET